MIKMKILYILFIFLFFTGIVSAQYITVVDKTTQQSIPSVDIFSNDMKIAVITDSKGKTEASAFKSADSIIFRHVGYETMVCTYLQLESMKFKVGLVEKKFSLDEIIVSANRWEENKSEIPYRIEKIKMKEVAFQNPQTAADMMGAGGYAYIQKSQLAGGSPALRGFATNRVMLVIDGVRMNNAIFRTGNVQNVISLDAASIETTEILFGPGAVMYGSDAIGGVMDFHTVTPKLADSSGKTLFTANAFGRYSTACNEKTGHIDFNIGLKKIAFVTSISYSEFGDLRAGSKGNSYYLRPSYVEIINGIDSMIVNKDSALQVGTGYSQYNVMQKVRFKPNKKWDFDYGFQYSATSDAPRYDRLYLDANQNGELDYAEWYYGPQKWMMNRIGIIHTQPTVVYNQLRVVAAMQNYEESRHDRKFGSSKLRNQTETVDALSVNLDLDKSFSEKLIIFYGAEAVHNTIGSVANKIHVVTEAEEPTTTRYPNGSTWQAYGAYVSLKYKLNPKLIANTGLRYSYYIVEADFDTSLFPFPFTHATNKNGALNGSLGLVYSPIKTWQIYLNGSTGFRAPNVDDIGKVFASVPGSVVVPNADLKPEYAYNGEIGTAKTFGNFLKVDITGYYTLLRDALARRNFQYNGQDSIDYDGQMSQVQAIQNITKAYVYGIQAGAEVNFGMGIGLKTIICFQHGEEESADSVRYYPMSHVAPMYGSTHLTYERKKFRFDFYAVYNGKVDYEGMPLAELISSAPVSPGLVNTPYAKDPNGYPYSPAWYTLNFKAAWYINKYLSLNVGVENIADKLYRPFESGITASGRNFIVAIKGKF